MWRLNRGTMAHVSRPPLPLTAHRCGAADPRQDAGLGRIALILGLTAALGVGSAGAALVAHRSSAPLSAMGTTAPEKTPEPTLTLAGQSGDTVPWQRPLTAVVGNGTLTSFAVTGPDGTAYAGNVSRRHFIGTQTLLPDSDYALTAVVTDLDGKTSTVERTVRSTKPAKVLRATVDASRPARSASPSPSIVRFNEPVKGAEARAAVLQRLQVTTAPAVEGAWRWYNSYEVHYRAQEYWKAGPPCPSPPT